MRRIRTVLPVIFAMLGLAVTATPALALSSFQRIFFQYQGTGTVDGCKWTAKQLADAQKQVPNDIQQYAPDFPAALQAAAERRASGACGGGTKKSTTAAPPVAPTTTPTTPAAPVQQASPKKTQPGQTKLPAATPPQPAPAPAPTVTDNAIPVAAKTSESGGGSDGLLILLAVLGGMLALGAVALGAARWWAWEPAWLVRWRHAGAEAGWRTSAAWAEFTDWVKLGR
jgi:hypothetical protein